MLEIPEESGVGIAAGGEGAGGGDVVETVGRGVGLDGGEEAFDVHADDVDAGSLQGGDLGGPFGVEGLGGGGCPGREDWIAAESGDVAEVGEVEPEEVLAAGAGDGGDFGGDVIGRGDGVLSGGDVVGSAPEGVERAGGRNAAVREEEEGDLVGHVLRVGVAGHRAADGVVGAAERAEERRGVRHADHGGELVDPDACGAAADLRVREVAYREWNAGDGAGGVSGAGRGAEGGDGGVAGVAEAVAERDDAGDLAGRDGARENAAGSGESGYQQESGLEAHIDSNFCGGLVVRGDDSRANGGGQ